MIKYSYPTGIFICYTKVAHTFFSLVYCAEKFKQNKTSELESSESVYHFVVHAFPLASFSVSSRTLVMCISLKEHATFGSGLFLPNLLISILQVLTLKVFWPYQNVSAGGFQATTRTCSLPSNVFVLYPFKSGLPVPLTPGSSCLVSFRPVEQDQIQFKSKGKLVLLFF